MMLCHDLDPNTFHNWYTQTKETRDMLTRACSEAFQTLCEWECIRDQLASSAYQTKKQYDDWVFAEQQVTQFERDYNEVCKEKDAIEEEYTMILMQLDRREESRERHRDRY